MRRQLSLYTLALLFCLPVQAQSATFGDYQDRLSAASRGPAASAAPQDLAEAGQALTAMRNAAPDSPEYAFQRDRLETRLREAELKGQAAENREYLGALKQQQDIYIAEIRQLKARQTELQSQIAQRRQAQAQRAELNAELERQRRGRLEAETRLARVAAESQQIEASLNALLSQWAQVREDSQGKHLRLDENRLFGRNHSLSSQGRLQIQNLAALLKALPERRFLVSAASGPSVAKAEALAQALIQAGLPAQSVSVVPGADLPAGQLELLVSSAPAPEPAPTQP